MPRATTQITVFWQKVTEPIDELINTCRYYVTDGDSINTCIYNGVTQEFGWYDEDGWNIFHDITHFADIATIKNFPTY